MKRLGTVIIVLFCITSAWNTVKAQDEELPGPCYFGDSGVGDCIISSSDMGIMILELNFPGPVDCSGVKPPDCSGRDIDGDEIITAADLGRMMLWLKQQYTNPNRTGLPAELVPVANPVIGSDSVGVAVRRIPASGSTNPANLVAGPAWGVVFSIDAVPALTLNLTDLIHLRF
jgi:hypothetical protein